MNNKKFGFTLAEVLITLGIIGVVAAMTLPTLINKTQKRELEVATKKFYSTLSQAVHKYMADEGIQDLRLSDMRYHYDGNNNENNELNRKNAQQNVNDFVRRYFKVVSECNSSNAEKCFADEYKDFSGNNFSGNYFVYGDMKAFVLQDGMVITVMPPGSYPMYVQVDVNGKKGPNANGYDLFGMSIFYDGTIDEGEVTPEIKKAGKASEVRQRRFNYCKCTDCGPIYGGCFGHFLENGFKFDY